MVEGQRRDERYAHNGESHFLSFVSIALNVNRGVGCKSQVNGEVEIKYELGVRGASATRAGLIAPKCWIFNFTKRKFPNQ